MNLKILFKCFLFNNKTFELVALMLQPSMAIKVVDELFHMLCSINASSLIFYLPMNGRDSLFFSRFPLSVGSGLRLLKKPHFQRMKATRARRNNPTMMPTIMIQIGISFDCG